MRTITIPTSLSYVNESITNEFKSQIISNSSYATTNRPYNIKRVQPKEEEDSSTSDGAVYIYNM